MILCVCVCVCERERERDRDRERDRQTDRQSGEKERRIFRVFQSQLLNLFPAKHGIRASWRLPLIFAEFDGAAV